MGQFANPRSVAPPNTIQIVTDARASGTCDPPLVCHFGAIDSTPALPIFALVAPLGIRHLGAKKLRVAQLPVMPLTAALNTIDPVGQRVRASPADNQESLGEFQNRINSVHGCSPFFTRYRRRAQDPPRSILRRSSKTYGHQRGLCLRCCGVAARESQRPIPPAY